MATKVEEIDLPITSTGDGGEPGHFRITQLPATKGHELNLLVVQMLGGALREVKGVEDIPKLIAGLSQQLTPAQEKDLRTRLLSCVSCNGTAVTEKNLDLYFTGELNSLYRVLGLALKVNMEGFFGGKLGAAIELIKTRVAAKLRESKSTEWSTSAGPSTESSSKPPDTEPSTIGRPS